VSEPAEFGSFHSQELSNDQSGPDVTLGAEHSLTRTSAAGRREPPLGSASEEGIPCSCGTCRGVPLLTLSSDFEGLVVSGLEHVPTYPDALHQLNEFARCRDFKELLAVTDEDELAKETFFTYAAGDIDPGCLKWAAIISFVVSCTGRSWWADRLIDQIRAAEDSGQ
jgi:hypothetical protein